jgi:aspartyl/glutamyl-tRNA(Asn/Gln) amidotransferase C subunit
MYRARVLDKNIQSLPLAALRRNQLLKSQAQCFAVKDLIMNEDAENISQERYIKFLQTITSRLHKLCDLARIRISEADEPRFMKDVSSIMHFLKFIKSAEFGGRQIEPMYSPIQRYNLSERAREDAVTQGNDVKSILQNAKQTKHNLFVVPGRDLGEL